MRGVCKWQLYYWFKWIVIIYGLLLSVTSSYKGPRHHTKIQNIQKKHIFTFREIFSVSFSSYVFYYYLILEFRVYLECIYIYKLEFICNKIMCLWVPKNIWQGWYDEGQWHPNHLKCSRLSGTCILMSPEDAC